MFTFEIQHRVLTHTHLSHCHIHTHSDNAKATQWKRFHNKITFFSFCEHTFAMFSLDSVFTILFIALHVLVHSDETGWQFSSETINLFICGASSQEYWCDKFSDNGTEISSQSALHPIFVAVPNYLHLRFIQFFARNISFILLISLHLLKFRLIPSSRCQFWPFYSAFSIPNFSSVQFSKYYLSHMAVASVRISLIKIDSEIWGDRNKK